MLKPVPSTLLLLAAALPLAAAAWPQWRVPGISHRAGSETGAPIRKRIRATR